MTDYINELSNLGLKENESKVYLYLLRTGFERTAGKIAAAIGIHRQYAYSALEVLKRLDLVDQIKFGKLFKYRAKSEKNLTVIAENKLLETNKLVDDLSKISKIEHHQNVFVHIGLEQVIKAELERAKETPTNTTQYLISGSNDQYLKTFKDIYLSQLIPLAIDKNISVKHLGSMKFEDRLKQKNNGQKFESRIIPGFESGSISILLSNDAVYFYSYVNPPTIYVIESESVYKSYLEFFNSLWSLGISA